MRALDSHAGGSQLVGIGAALVTQHIVTAGHDISRRQLGQVGRVQRRRAPISGDLRVSRAGAEIVIAEPDHRRRRQRQHIGARDVALRAHREIHHRVDQQLEPQRRPALVACHQRHDGRQIAARAVAADAEPRWINFQTGRVCGNPDKRCERIIDRGRKPVLRRQPVVDRNHARTTAVGKLPAERIVGIEIADHPAAAVVVDQRGQHGVRRHPHRPVEPQRDRTSRSRRHQVTHLGHLRRVRLQDGAARNHCDARIRRRLLLQRRPSRQLEEIEHFLAVGIEGHGSIRCGRWREQYRTRLFRSLSNSDRPAPRRLDGVLTELHAAGVVRAVACPARCLNAPQTASATRRRRPAIAAVWHHRAPAGR